MNILKNRFLAAALGLLLCLSAAAPALAAGPVQWLNHLAFTPGVATLATTFDAVNSGVGSGLSGLIITSTATGDTGPALEQGVQVPPGFLVNGVRVCYELSSAQSYISQVRISQLQDPPATAVVRLDDGSDLVAPGPVCVDSAQPAAGPVDPQQGALRLDLGAAFAATTDRIVLRGVGLLLVPDPNSPLLQAIAELQDQVADLEEALENHTHTYLTGRGTGHNNTVAVSGPATFAVAPAPVAAPPIAPQTGKKKK